MRKILAGFLATSMIVAVASSVTFAATTPSSQAASISFTVASSGNASWGGTVNVNGAVIPGAVNSSAANIVVNPVKLKATYTKATVKLPNEGGITFDIPMAGTKTYTIGTGDITKPSASAAAIYKVSAAVPTAADVADLLDGQTFSVNVNGVAYTGAVSYDTSANQIVLKFDQVGNVDTDSATITIAKPSLELELAEIDPDNATANDEYTDTVESASWNTAKGAFSVPTLALANAQNGTAKGYADVETAGSLKNMSVNDVIFCDGNLNPMVFTEHLGSVGGDQNGEDGVQSSRTLYFLLRDDAQCRVDKLEDDTFWKLKITKGDNGKYIKAISDVTKNFSDGLYAMDGKRYSETVGRRRYIKVELNEIFTDDEYKITLDMRLSPKSKAVDAQVEVNGSPVSDDSEIKVKDFFFYMKNIVKPADNDWKVGIGGLMLNPISNDWNDVTYFDEDGDLAHVKFFADSDTSKFYAKLSTKWEHADYASYFNDQDAYIFDFVGSPKLSATSRADLEIYNPFVDNDGKETIDPASATIYQVIDGDLFDVTDSFEYKEGENGDMAFVTRTRFLGTYIICEKPVEEAADTEAPDTDLVPEEAPSEVTPDGGSNDGGKAPANTGKYL